MCPQTTGCHGLEWKHRSGGFHDGRPRKTAAIRRRHGRRPSSLEPERCPSSSGRSGSTLFYNGRANAVGCSAPPFPLRASGGVRWCTARASRPLKPNSACTRLWRAGGGGISQAGWARAATPRLGDWGRDAIRVVVRHRVPRRAGSARQQAEYPQVATGRRNAPDLSATRPQARVRPAGH
jgi:hypothetical protein